MEWQYFRMVLASEEADVYKLVDEAGQALMEDDHLLLFANHKEAEEYLIEHDIRGSVR